jgi:hypothetical protein
MGELDLLFLLLAALFAGFIDAVAGGGGLIQVPTLLVALPGETPATVFGTNKLSSIFGTGNAALRYATKDRIALGFGVAGRRRCFLVFLWRRSGGVPGYRRTWFDPWFWYSWCWFWSVHRGPRPAFGTSLAGTRLDEVEGMESGACWLAPVLGFYDGFFRARRRQLHDFCLRTLVSAGFSSSIERAAKVVNLATNAAALAYFVPGGNVLWGIGLGMAMFNILGAMLGAHALHSETRQPLCAGAVSWLSHPC